MAMMIIIIIKNMIGIISGVMVLALNAFMAFICVTFVIEAMSSSNFMLKRNEEGKRLLGDSTSVSLPLEEEPTKKKRKKKTEQISPEVQTYISNPFSIMERYVVGIYNV